MRGSLSSMSMSTSSPGLSKLTSSAGESGVQAWEGVPPGAHPSSATRQPGDYGTKPPSLSIPPNLRVSLPPTDPSLSYLSLPSPFTCPVSSVLSCSSHISLQIPLSPWISLSLSSSLPPPTSALTSQSPRAHGPTLHVPSPEPGDALRKAKSPPFCSAEQKPPLIPVPAKGGL